MLGQVKRMERITSSEIDKAIFKPSKEDKNDVQDKDEREVVAYTERLQEVDEKSPDAYAKRVNVNGRTYYYVKQDSYGRLYNPSGMYSENRQNKQLRHAGRPNWVFREVEKKVYDLYTKFLETKNAAWLSNAEREMV